MVVVVVEVGVVVGIVVVVAKVVVVYAILLYSSAVLQQFNEHGSAMPVPSTTVFKSFDFDRDFKGVKVSTVS